MTLKIIKTIFLLIVVVLISIVPVFGQGQSADQGADCSGLGWDDGVSQDTPDGYTEACTGLHGCTGIQEMEECTDPCNKGICGAGFAGGARRSRGTKGCVCAEDAPVTPQTPPVSPQQTTPTQQQPPQQTTTTQQQPPQSTVTPQSFGGIGTGSSSTGSGVGATATFRNPLKYESFKDFLFALVDGITIVLMPLIVLLIAYIGFRMVLAGREKNADYTRWKNAFAMALIGLFLILGTRGIFYVIQNTVKDVLGDEYVEDLLGE